MKFSFKIFGINVYLLSISKIYILRRISIIKILTLVSALTARYIIFPSNSKFCERLQKIHFLHLPLKHLQKNVLHYIRSDAKKPTKTYKYLGIWETDNIKQVEMKDKFRKEYLRRTRKPLETKLSSRNLIKGKKYLGCAPLRYSGPFLKWTRDELKQMDQRTRKLMTIHKVLHPRDDVDRLSISRKEGGSGVASMDTTARRLHRKIRTRTNDSHQKRYGQHDRR